MAKQESTKVFTCWSREGNYDKTRHYEKNIADLVDFGSIVTGEGVHDYWMTMQWLILPDNKPPAPRLCVFNDAFRGIEEHSELFAELARLHNVDFTPKEFSELLLRLGYEDTSSKKLE
jgi:hypothetical protein